jgi:hypothetical protein
MPPNKELSMRTETMNIACTPAGEECEALGPNYNPVKARAECRIFMDQLIRQFGHPPVGARLTIISNPHEFGTYYEVGVKYNPDCDEAVDYAFKLESETPESWDDQAKKDLKNA